MSGLSVSIRERDNLFQIWNTSSDLHEKSTVIQKVKELVTSTELFTVYYTGIRANISGLLLLVESLIVIVIVVIQICCS